jgi:hypothetical protein
MPAPLSSPFQDSLSAIFEERQQAGEARKSDLDRFDEAWKKLRHETIHPVLDEAAQFFRGHSYNSLVKNENGESMTLVVGRYQLIFSADRSKLKISCVCPPLLAEDFDTGKLDRAQVEDKVRELAKVVER